MNKAEALKALEKMAEKARSIQPALSYTHPDP
jgi:hypothetical protein